MWYCQASRMGAGGDRPADLFGDLACNAAFRVFAEFQFAAWEFPFVALVAQQQDSAVADDDALDRDRE